MSKDHLGTISVGSGVWEIIWKLGMSVLFQLSTLKEQTI